MSAVSVGTSSTNAQGSGGTLTKAKERYLAQQRTKEWFSSLQTLAVRHKRHSDDVDSTLKKCTMDVDPTLWPQHEANASSRLQDYRSLLIGLRRLKTGVLTVQQVREAMDPVEVALRHQEALLGDVDQEAKHLLATMGGGGTSSSGHQEVETAGGGPKVASARVVTTAPASGAPEVAEYDAFLRLHGDSANLGWPVEEHSAFLRTLLHAQALFNGSNAATVAGVVSPPHPQQQLELLAGRRAEVVDLLKETFAHTLGLSVRSSEEFYRHLDLYETYVRLHDAKRIALAAWKEERNADANNEAELRRLRHAKKEEEARQEGLLKDYQSAKVRESNKKQVEIWRVQKNERDLAEKKQKADALVQKQKEEIAVRQMRQLERDVILQRRRDEIALQQQHLDPTAVDLPSTFAASAVRGISSSRLNQQQQAKTDARPTSRHDLQRRHCDDTRRTMQRKTLIEQRQHQRSLEHKMHEQSTYLRKEHPGASKRTASSSGGGGGGMSRLVQPTASSNQRAKSTAAHQQQRAASSSGGEGLLRGASYLSPKPLCGLQAGAGWYKAGYQR